MGSAIVVMSAPLEVLKDKVRKRLSWKKSVIDYYIKSVLILSSHIYDQSPTLPSNNVSIAIVISFIKDQNIKK